MAQISKAYTYKLPDTYFGNTSLEGKMATAIYDGFDKGFVFVDNDGLLHKDEGFHPWNGREEEKEAFATRAGLSRKAILLDTTKSDDDTLIAAICTGQDTSSWPTVEYTFDDGTVYHVDPDPLPVNIVLDVENIYYDLENNVWKIDEIGFSSTITMEQHIINRDNLLKEVEEYISDPANEVTQEQLDLLDVYVQELNNIYTKFEGIHPRKIAFPSWPIGPDEEPTV